MLEGIWLVTMVEPRGYTVYFRQIRVQQRVSTGPRCLIDLSIPVLTPLF
jgi:hypothetical protein